MSLLILFLVFVFISKLFLYKEWDFDIPKDFFDTINTYKDAESEDNWFKDYVCFIQWLTKLNTDWTLDRWMSDDCKTLNNKIDLNYFDILSKCTFQEKQYMSWSIFLEEKCNIDLDKSFNEYIEEHDKDIDDKYNEGFSYLNYEQIKIVKKYLNLSSDDFIKDFYNNFKDTHTFHNYLKTFLDDSNLSFINREEWINWFHKSIWYLFENNKIKINSKNEILTKSYNKDFENNDFWIEHIFKIFNITDKDIIKYKSIENDKNKFLNKKYFKLEESKIRKLKEFYSYFIIESIDDELKNIDIKMSKLTPGDIDFYKVFDYINQKKVYGNYNRILEELNRQDIKIDNIAALAKYIDQINYWIINDERIIAIVNYALIDNLKLTLKDFKQYREDSIFLENNKQEIIDSNFKNFKNFVKINELKYKKINNKEFIKYTDDFNYDENRSTKDILFSWLIKYSRSIRYISQDYFDKWEYKKWFNILLNHQKFIDNVITKSDFNIINNLALMTINKINLNFIDISIEKYDLSAEMKKYIFNSLNQEVIYWLIDEWLKIESLWTKYYYKFIWNEVFKKEKNEWFFEHYFSNITSYLFFSVEESEILKRKQYFDMISNNLWSDFELWYNISNKIGRNALWLSYSYASQYETEEDMILLRESILEKLNN